MAGMASTYNKPFLTVDEQLDRLTERGMYVEDPDAAIRKLQAIGYFRLSGYWYPFRRKAATPGQPRPSKFIHGTTFQEVLDIYYFDEQLRSELLRALGRIEISLRFWVGHRLGKRGPFAHTDLKQLDFRAVTETDDSGASLLKSDAHDEWMEKQRKAESISNEAFVAHFSNNYGEPLPIWAATETMTFETLNRLYGGLMQQDRDQIAVEFDLFRADGNGDSHILSNWLEHLRQTRNICAHHARLWNRNHTAPLAISGSSEELQHLLTSNNGVQGNLPVTRRTSRIYGTLALISYLLARIDHTNTMRDRLLALVSDFAIGRPDRWYSMGFPKDWERHSLWAQGYARDPQRVAQAEMLRDVELLYTKDAAAQLTIKDGESARRSLLNYYRRNGAVLSVPGTSAHRYPAFQFNELTGNLHEIVVLANRRLLDGGIASVDDRWGTLKWWLSPASLCENHMSPVRALQAGALTRELLDQVLPPRSDE